jgi:transcriptional regulator with XRE-family HTH domain
MVRKKKSVAMSARKTALMLATRELRRQLNFSQEEIAEKVGVTVGTYSKWERGVMMPGPSQRERLADIAKGHGLPRAVRAFYDKPEPRFIEEAFKSWGLGSIVELLDVCKLVVFNWFSLDDEGEEQIATVREIRRMMYGCAERLVKQARATGAPPLLIGDEQYELWERLMERYGGATATPLRRKPKKRRPQ